MVCPDRSLSFLLRAGVLDSVHDSYRFITTGVHASRARISKIMAPACSPDKMSHKVVTLTLISENIPQPLVALLSYQDYGVWGPIEINLTRLLKGFFHQVKFRSRAKRFPTILRLLPHAPRAGRPRRMRPKPQNLGSSFCATPIRRNHHHDLLRMST